MYNFFGCVIKAKICVKYSRDKSVISGKGSILSYPPPRDFKIISVFQTSVANFLFFTQAHKSAKYFAITKLLFFFNNITHFSENLHFSYYKRACKGTIKTIPRSKILPGKVINKDFIMSGLIAYIINRTIKVQYLQYFQTFPSDIFSNSGFIGFLSSFLVILIIFRRRLPTCTVFFYDS